MPSTACYPCVLMLDSDELLDELPLAVIELCELLLPLEVEQLLLLPVDVEELDELLDDDELELLNACELLLDDELDTITELELDSSRSPIWPVITTWTLIEPLAPWYWILRTFRLAVTAQPSALSINSDPSGPIWFFPSASPPQGPLKPLATLTGPI